MKRPIFLDYADSMDIVEVKQRIVPATREALMKFPKAELQSYASSLRLVPNRLKLRTIDALMESGRATLCASLGD